MLQNLASSPERFNDHILHYSAGVILDVRLPMSVLLIAETIFRSFTELKSAARTSHLLTWVNELWELWLTQACPGSFSLTHCHSVSIYYVPLFARLTSNPVKHWPAWLWEGGFQEMARVWRKSIRDFIEIPYDACLKVMRIRIYHLKFF